jgi:hypothetical protein
MKIIGTGEPCLMTVSLEAGEDALWRETLEELRSVIRTAPHCHGEHGREPGGEGGRTGFRYDERQQVERLLQQIEFAADPPGEMVSVIGPTPLVHEIAHASARLAGERFLDAVGVHHTSRFDPAELERARAALDACAATLVDFDFVDNHGLEY